MRGCLEKWPYPHLRCGVRNLAHFLELFQCTLYHPHTAHTLLHMADHPKHVPRLLIVMCMIQRLLKCTHKAYTIWICTTSMIVDCVHWVVSLTFSSLWKFNTLSTSCSVCKRNIASLTFLIFQSDQGAYSICSEMVNLAATFCNFFGK